VARTCRHAGIPASFHDADAAPGMRQSNRTLDACLTDEFSHRNTLFCLNPDLLPPVWQRLADRGDLRDRRAIGFWFWEIDAFPKKWRPALDLVDEIWVASEFVGNVIRRVTDKPVIKIPHAIRASCSRRYARAEFSLPEHRFLFLFTFDFDSSFERKNPLAIVEAFGRAFPAGDDRAGLVIKCVQGHGYPEKRDRLDALAAKDPRICVLDKFLSREDVYGLQSVCDAYISLHRSEGLSLGMAECMAQGKPVIATAYSGNLEFMTRDNSCLVDFALIPVRPGEYIDYEPGWLWADPDIDQAARYMVRVRDDPDYRSRIAERAASDMATRFGDQASGAAITRRLVELAQP
jgi:glycosyltransferase involved in cell wall biosynthesis